jgi:hypothetical protein
MKDQPIVMEGAYAKQYTDWHIKTGGFARDKTLRDEFASKAMRPLVFSKPTYDSWDEVAKNAYEIADAMLNERAK